MVPLRRPLVAPWYSYGSPSGIPTGCTISLYRTILSGLGIKTKQQRDETVCVCRGERGGGGGAGGGEWEGRTFRRRRCPRSALSKSPLSWRRGRVRGAAVEQRECHDGGTTGRVVAQRFGGGGVRAGRF